MWKQTRHFCLWSWQVGIKQMNQLTRGQRDDAEDTTTNHMDRGWDDGYANNYYHNNHEGCDPGST